MTKVIGTTLSRSSLDKKRSFRGGRAKTHGTVPLDKETKARAVLHRRKFLAQKLLKMREKS